MHASTNPEAALYTPCVADFQQWRMAARALLSADIAPAQVHWQDSAPSPLRGRPLPTVHSELRMSRRLLRLLQQLSCHRQPGRWSLMYELAWRQRRQPDLLLNQADAQVRQAMLMRSAIQRECHKMHAFVRFRERLLPDGSKHYHAWYEPEHEVLPLAVPFFCKRFPNMRWTIATPTLTADWRDGKLQLSRTTSSGATPADGQEQLWRTYYRSICNVNRINPAAMQREMPQRYWHNLPEAAEIQPLLQQGRMQFAQQQRMAQPSPAQARAMQQALAHLPAQEDELSTCRRCTLWQQATQPVPGEGPATASIMLVGEQPGDEEDLRGRVFIGPAGKLLDAALLDAGLARSELFLTNAVKHFKWQPRGKRRLHQRANVGEVQACNHWLRQEIERVQPRIIVSLGRTAMRAVLGVEQPIETARRQPSRHASGAWVVCTYHPAAVLRALPPVAKAMRSELSADLRQAATMARTLSAQARAEKSSDNAGHFTGKV